MLFTYLDNYPYNQNRNSEYDCNRNQDRQENNKFNCEIFEKASNPVNICRKALCNSRTRALCRSWRVALHLVDIEVDRAVIHLIVIGAKLGFHAFDLIAYIGQLLVDRNDILDRFCLLHHGKEAFLFCQKCLFVALQIHILQRYILCGFRFSRHIGLLGNSRQIAVELLRRNSCRQTCASGSRR